MARYIAIPSVDEAVASLEPPGGGFSAEARSKRVETIKSLRRRYDRSSVPVSAVETLNRTHKATVIADPRNHASLTGVTIFEGEPDARDALQNEMPGFRVIEDFQLDLVPPRDAGVDTVASEDVDTWHLDAIGLTRARKRGFTGTGKGVGVAVMDTGIDEVGDIRGRIASAWELKDGMPEEIQTRDTHGHGTRVAGLIAGRKVGVAPEADLLNFVMVPFNSWVPYSDFIIAIEFVLHRPEISIMNLSVGYRGWTPEIRHTILTVTQACILPVIAIGNEGPDTSRSPGNYSEAFSVGASNKNNRIWASSGSGTVTRDVMSYPVPDIVAPGEDVTSCVMDGLYSSQSGTSMAASVVSGVAALMIEKYRDISEPALRGELIDACVQLTDAQPIRQGAGLLQLPTTLWFTGV